MLPRPTLTGSSSVLETIGNSGQAYYESSTQWHPFFVRFSIIFIKFVLVKDEVMLHCTGNEILIGLIILMSYFQLLQKKSVFIYFLLTWCD